MKQKELSNWLKVIIVICGILGLLFCVYFGPEIGKEVLLNSEKMKVLYNPFIVFIWITGIPFYIALTLGWKICLDISTNQAFNIKNANRLKQVSILAMIECFFYFVALIYLFIVKSISINMLIIILLILFFAFVISVLTSILSQLVREANKIKTDNDLTI
ncbi:DUF2975 domain-containing protein [Virgibacillus proomii]|jgi:hypothetical protein|uniref:DUF2975 domain-containing protein n=1 Tax=Virgibacillus proomii TaxID=84407 RepID=UPI00098790F8|nr:DUF2975 domain-containing protein [Virgibacillus proomii]